MNFIRKKALLASAAIYVGAFSSTAAHAATTKDFADITKNINKSVQEFPGLLSSLSYMFGLLFAVLGILKIKDHVEQPQQTPLREGAIRLAAGGALFALPIISEAMDHTISDGGGTAVDVATMHAAHFATK